MDNALAAVSQLEQDPKADVAGLVSSYQLKPHLLDAIIPKSLRLLSEAYVATREPELLQTIYVFSRVRGHKIVIQHLKTDATLVESLLASLIELNGSGQWQAEYALLLWLASVVLTPFELDNIAENLWARLYEHASRFLDTSGIQRDAAATLVARLLVRKREDQSKLVDRFVAQYTSEGNVSFGLGQLQVLEQVMDRVSSVPPSIHRLVTHLTQATEQQKTTQYYTGMLTSRLWIKIMGRVALRELSDFAEFTVAECFTLLDDKSTRVRMTAAKYIARITAKLPDENAEEICGALVSSLDEDVAFASPDYYNGAILALAEIVRRKLLSNQKILDCMITNVLQTRALHFLQERLNTQIGANVRDSACYLCWSIFRSVPNLNLDLLKRLFTSLIALAILDHEVNVRRAAAAALQEGFGRYGNVDAQEIFSTMERINFQSVSLVTYSYLDIAPFFCDRDDFFEYFLLHGVTNANADMRRLAAKAIVNFQPRLRVEVMIDRLLETAASASETHGVMLALGSLYVSSNTDHRKLDSQKYIVEPGESDLATEAVLRLLPIAPERAASIVEAVHTEEKHVVDAMRDLSMYLPSEVLDNSVLPVCVRRMSQSIAHVACIVAMARPPTDIILQAARLNNPESRAMAVSRLETDIPETQSQLVSALNDYSIDDRGDVGGWVREAAIARVMALRSRDIPEITDALWTMGSNSRQKLRMLAGKALLDLGHVAALNFESPHEYYYSLLKATPESKYDIVARGIAASVGGLYTNMTTTEGSFRGLIRYLDEGNDWVISKILNLDRSTVPKCAEVVRTLRRLLAEGIEIEPWKRVLAIAFNTTITPRLPEPLVLDAVDILSTFADCSRDVAGSRLIKLVKTHWSGRVRQTAADALFEAGIENEVLETTDWTRNDYKVHALKLEINM